MANLFLMRPNMPSASPVFQIKKRPPVGMDDPLRAGIRCQSIELCWWSSRQKNYAVGLEKSCPGGVCYWAPEIPSPHRIAAATSDKCELAHTRRSFFSKRRRLPHAVIDKRWLHGRLRNRPNLSGRVWRRLKKAPIRRQHQNRKHLKSLAPRAGFEPATIRLTVECSTAELPRNEANWVRVGAAYNKASGACKGRNGPPPREPAGREKSLRHSDCLRFGLGRQQYWATCT
jgi:hypothetical protein